MEEQRPQPQESLAHRHQHSVESIVTLLEWLVVAFILALLFMTFAMQAFQIPTGSMAETLRGDHYQIRCSRCGYTFDVGNNAVSYRQPQCANCGYIAAPHAMGRVKNGDRIFVLKSIYQFFEPQRWDVVVFKNPTNPLDNYIKRLIALPGETVQLMYGDVFIDGEIVRKPVNVQKELWMPIFLQDHQPLEAAGHLNGLIEQGEDKQNKLWSQRFVNEPNSTWDIQGNTVFTLNGQPGTEHTLIYVPKNRNDFRAFYGYNESSGYAYKPVVSDLMITFYVQCADSNGHVGASLEKYGARYSAKVDYSGTMVFTKTVNGETTQLRPPIITEISQADYEKFEFAVVDQQLVLHWGQNRYTYDLSTDESFKPKNAHYEKPPTLTLFATGPTKIRHIELYRDTYYMGEEAGAYRATEDDPFELQKDQFFVCGDNSNDSLDCRLWSKKGTGNHGRTYRTGVVPRDYMMGKAVMIYWSQAFQFAQNSPSFVPNFNNLNVIYGGSETEY